MSATEDTSTRIIDQFAAYRCKYHLRLYAATGNGAHVWRAYTAFRRMSGNQPLPPMIAEYFDQCARQLESAESPAAIKTALCLAKYDDLLGQNISGQGHGFGYADTYSKQRDVVAAVARRFCLLYERGDRPLLKDLIKDEAKRSGRSERALKLLLRDWGITKKKLVQLVEDR